MKKFKQKRGTAIGTKFAPPFELGEVHRCHIFHLGHGQVSLNAFIDQVNMFHPTTKFTVEY